MQDDPRFEFGLANREYPWANAYTESLPVNVGTVSDIPLKNLMDEIEKNMVYGIVIRHQSNEAGIVRCDENACPLLSRKDMAKAHLILQDGTTKIFNAPLEHICTEPHSNDPGKYMQVLFIRGIDLNKSVIRIAGGSTNAVAECIEITFLPAVKGCKPITTCN